MAEISPKLSVEYKARRYAAGLKPAPINRELASSKKAFNLASPVTGGRHDEQSPQLGPGNRGTGQLGRPLINPNQVRSEPSGPGTIVGQVLSVRGDTYIVREPDGHEVVLKSTKATDVQSVINMGQTVEAQVDSTGALIQIKPTER